MADERLCVTCPVLAPNHPKGPRHYEREWVCEPCRATMADALAEIPELYALLPEFLEPGRGNGPRVSGTPSRALGVALAPLSLLSPVSAEPPPPPPSRWVPLYRTVPPPMRPRTEPCHDVNAILERVCVRDYGHRSRHGDSPRGGVTWPYRQGTWRREPVLGPDGRPRLVPALALVSLDGRERLVPAGGSDQHGALPPLVLLDQWAEDWAEMRGEHRPVPTMTSLCAWLTHRLDWACQHHPAIDDFADELRRRVLRALGGACGLSESRAGEFVGWCPNPRGEGLCATPLWVDPYVTQVRCARCARSWDRTRDEWVTLKADQEAAGLARWQKGAA